MDLSTQKSVFTAGIYQLASDAIMAFFHYPLLSPSKIEVQSDLDVDKVLSVKTNNYTVEFTKDSH